MEYNYNRKREICCVVIVRIVRNQISIHLAKSLIALIAFPLILIQTDLV